MLGAPVNKYQFLQIIYTALLLGIRDYKVWFFPKLTDEISY